MVGLRTGFLLFNTPFSFSQHFSQKTLAICFESAKVGIWSEFQTVLVTVVKNILQENAAPMLVQNGVGHVSLGDVLMITPDLLMAKVVDIENTETDDAIYTLVPPLNNPQDGKTKHFIILMLNVRT